MAIKNILEGEIPEVGSFRANERTFKEVHLDLDTYDKFISDIHAMITSIDTDVKNNVQDSIEIMKEINSEINLPTVKNKDWSNNMWYRLFKRQREAYDKIVKASAYKVWMIKFLAISNNKLYELVNSLSKKINEIERIKAERDLYDKMQNALTMERERYHAIMEKRQDKIDEEMNRIKEQVNKLFLQVELLVNEISTLKKVNIPLLPHTQLPTTSTKIQHEELKEEPKEEKKPEPKQEPEPELEPEPEPEQQEEEDEEDFFDFDLEGL